MVTTLRLKQPTCFSSARMHALIRMFNAKYRQQKACPKGPSCRLFSDITTITMVKFQKAVRKGRWFQLNSLLSSCMAGSQPYNLTVQFMFTPTANVYTTGVFICLLLGSQNDSYLSDGSGTLVRMPSATSIKYTTTKRWWEVTASTKTSGLLLLVSHTAAARAVQIFAVSIFEYGASIRNLHHLQKFPISQHKQKLVLWQKVEHV